MSDGLFTTWPTEQGLLAPRSTYNPSYHNTQGLADRTAEVAGARLADLLEALVGSSLDPLARPLATSAELILDRIQGQWSDGSEEIPTALAEIIETIERLLSGDALPEQTARGPQPAPESGPEGLPTDSPAGDDASPDSEGSPEDNRDGQPDTQMPAGSRGAKVQI